MDETFKTSSYPRHRNDVEAGDVHGEEDEEASSTPFDIYRTKDASKDTSLQRLRRWRQAALVLNATHRFRYTLDLKREEKMETMRKAALLFKVEGLQVKDLAIFNGVDFFGHASFSSIPGKKDGVFGALFGMLAEIQP